MQGMDRPACILIRFANSDSESMTRRQNFHSVTQVHSILFTKYLLSLALLAGITAHPLLHEKLREYADIISSPLAGVLPFLIASEY